MYSKKKINSFVSVFPTSKPKFVLAVMLDEPKNNKDYIYHYRDGSNIKYKGTPFNTAGWTTVEATEQIVEKICFFILLLTKLLFSRSLIIYIK